jgi:hypothetical protein
MLGLTGQFARADPELFKDGTRRGSILSGKPQSVNHMPTTVRRHCTSFSLLTGALIFG